MRKILLLSALSATISLAACSSDSLSDAPAPASEEAAAEQAGTEDLPPAAAPSDGLPIDATAEVPRDSQQACPYLDSQWLAETNGQRVTSQGIDTRFDPPACVFWSYPEHPQATVLVRRMATEDEAVAVVDWAAPIDLTEPAGSDGWDGGRGVLNDELSVYAVYNGPVAVVVWSNQAQTIKPQSIATEVISALNLP